MSDRRILHQNSKSTLICANKVADFHDIYFLESQQNRPNRSKWCLRCISMRLGIFFCICVPLLRKQSQTLHDIAFERSLVDPSKCIQSLKQCLGVQRVSVLHCMIDAMSAVVGYTTLYTPPQYSKLDVQVFSFYYLSSLQFYGCRSPPYTSIVFTLHSILYIYVYGTLYSTPN